jgi:hypothetical protein
MCRNIGDVAVADADIGLAVQQRRQQLRDVGGGVLVVGVGVDDEIGAGLERGVDAGGESGGEPLVATQPDDVIDAAGTRHVRRPVARPVVDDQHLDDVDAGNRLGQIGERRRQRLRLVQARDLDDELLHPALACTSVSITPSQVIVRARS